MIKKWTIIAHHVNDGFKVINTLCKDKRGCTLEFDTHGAAQSYRRYLIELARDNVFYTVKPKEKI
ncbi:MAG TPA: hypothetical protein PLC59_08000 [Bacteroidales bacterium]|nr:hypothetical protein [Bacteroidales bacterium]HQI45984.1 hypothetical protein [Bacteroidales bacterium]